MLVAFSRRNKDGGKRKEKQNKRNIKTLFEV